MTPTTAATMKAVEITGPRDVRIVDPSTAPISTEMLVTVTTAKSVEPRVRHANKQQGRNSLTGVGSVGVATCMVSASER